jgi:molybdenum cofactor cytidylyltransferase
MNAPYWCGILLAAGKGRRFDVSGVRNKLLQPLPSGMPVAAASAQNLCSALPRSLAVLSARTPAMSAMSAMSDELADKLAAVLAKAGCELSVCAPVALDVQDGMARSLVHGLRQAPDDCAGWIIALADMPYVQPASMLALVQALRDGAGIAVPVHQGRRGNPVGFSRQYLPQLLELTGDQGARALLKTYPVTEVLVDDPGIFKDIDLPQDLSDGLNISNSGVSS